MSKPRRTVLWLTLSLFPCGLLAAEECPVPGKAMHWLAEYCMYLSATDDFLSGTVAACFENKGGYLIEDNCENKMRIKRKICEQRVNDENYRGNVDQCVNDKEFIPATVRNDGI